MSSNAVFRFIKLKQFFDLFLGRKKLDCISEGLLEKIMLNYDEGLYVSIGDLISASGDLGSVSSLQQHIKKLSENGFIVLQPHPDDGRVKIPYPSESSKKYYEELGLYASKCFESGSFDVGNLSEALTPTGLLSQAYIKAHAEALSAYSRAEKCIKSSKTLLELSQKVCEAVTSQPLYICAWIGFSSIESSRAIEMVAVSGSAEAYGRDLKLSWDPNSIYGSGPTGIAIRSGKSVVMSDTEMTSNFGPWVENARRHGIRSSISTPLISKDKSSGILIIYAKEPYSFGPSEIFLFEKLGSLMMERADAMPGDH